MASSSLEGVPNPSADGRKGKQCAVKGCSNRFYDSTGKATGLHFFKFPATPVWRRTRWCNLVGRQHKKDDFQVTSSTVVCEKHFRPEDVKRVPGGTRWSLREGLFTLLGIECTHVLLSVAFYVVNFNDNIIKHLLENKCLK